MKGECKEPRVATQRQHTRESGGTSRLVPGHEIYPRLLGGLKITRPNQVWAVGMAYVLISRGLSGGHHRLVQTVCAFLEAVKHTGCGLLSSGHERGAQEG